MSRVVGARQFACFLSLKPLLPCVRFFYKYETIQVFVEHLINLNELSAHHPIKDSCVLIELGPLLFIELWQRLLYSSPSL